MNITVLTSSYPRYPGDGTAPFIMSFCEQLVRLGHSVEVVAPYDAEVKPDGQGGVLVHRFRYIWPARYHIMGHARALQADVKVRWIAYLLLPFYLFAAIRTLNRVIRLQKTDLIHVHWVLPNGVAAMLVTLWRKIPFIVSLHGSDMYLAKRNSIYGAIARMIFSRAQGVTACSPELLSSALELDAPRSSILLPYGVDPVRFHPDNRDPGFRRELTGGRERTLILALGRLVYKKGFTVLINAFSEVVKTNPDALLLIAGDGPLRETLTLEAKKCNVDRSILLIGPLSWGKVPAFLASGDMFILPSIRDHAGNIDGLPNVLLEAMSSGLPVISSDIPGVKLVLEQGDCGILVPSGDAKSLSVAMTGLITDPDAQRAMGTAARRTIENRFTWPFIGQKLAGYIEEVMN